MINEVQKIIANLYDDIAKQITQDKQKLAALSFMATALQQLLTTNLINEVEQRKLAILFLYHFMQYLQQHFPAQLAQVMIAKGCLRTRWHTTYNIIP